MVREQRIIDASHNSRIAENNLIRFTDDADDHARNVESSVCHEIEKNRENSQIFAENDIFLLFSPNVSGHVFRIQDASRTLQNLPGSSQNNS